MKISVICVGKLKERYWSEAVAEYCKRLKRFSQIEVIEVAEEATSEDPSEAQILKCKEKEGQRLLQKVDQGAFCIVMDLKGKKPSSTQFAEKLKEIPLQGKSHIAFLIGGSFGLSADCIKRGDFLFSMSDLTFPHQMARVILLEQIYRAMKINANEKYHK